MNVTGKSYHLKSGKISLQLYASTKNFTNKKMTYILNCDNTYENWLIASPDIVKRNNDRLSSDENITQETRKIFGTYLSKLKRHVHKEDLKVMYNNLKTLIINRNILMILYGITGAYYPISNRIEYVFKKTISHEFLHMASSQYDEKNNVILSGFSQHGAKESRKIGNGLDEGYTSLLKARFYTKSKKVSSYQKLAEVAKLLELFFDDPKDMTHYYLTHDLPGFIHHMTKWFSKTEIVYIIKQMDIIYKNLKSKDQNEKLNIDSKILKLKLLIYKVYIRTYQNEPDKINKFIKCLKKDQTSKKALKLYKDNPYEQKANQMILRKK